MVVYQHVVYRRKIVVAGSILAAADDLGTLVQEYIRIVLYLMASCQQVVVVVVEEGIRVGSGPVDPNWLRVLVGGTCPEKDPVVVVE